jgi:hypothetical protein
LSSYLCTSCFADDTAAAAGATPASTEGPPPPPLLPPPPVPDSVALETEAVVFAAAVLIGEGVAEAETKLKEDAAKRAAVEAQRMLSILLPAAFLLLLFFNRLMPAAAVDKARHDVGDDGEEEDGGCRSCPGTRVAADVAKAEPAVEEVDTEVEVIVLLLSARHDDDNRAERVAVHAAQDAMILFLNVYVAETTSPNQLSVVLLEKKNYSSRLQSVYNNKWQTVPLLSSRWNNIETNIDLCSQNN